MSDTAQPTDLINPEEPAPALAAPNVELPTTGDPIMEMAQRASQNNDVATLKTLLEIRDQERANAAKQAFNSAFAKAQAEFPIIPRRGRGHNNIQYARLEDIIQGIKPVLAKYGMGLRHRTETKDGITVTAILSHVDGHFEEDVFEAGADNSGSKNAVQAIKSTITYARRTTAENILGLASHGEDDDAFLAGASDHLEQTLVKIQDAKTADDLARIKADILSYTDWQGDERTRASKAWAARNHVISMDAK